MKRIWTAVITAAVLGSAAGHAIAQQPPAGGPPARLATALGLTDEQKAVWAAAFQTMRATAEPLREQAKQIHSELRALLDQGTPDPTAVGQKAIALHAVHQQIKQARETMEATTASVLSPEQKQQLAAIKAAHPHRGHWGKPGGFGAPPVTQ